MRHLEAVGSKQPGKITDAVLKGESLCNDMTELLLFSGALTVLGGGGLSLPVDLRLGFAAPGGLLLGFSVTIASAMSIAW
ncbi:hypothetical protein BDD14_0304 [Edaphobacter modestus]|uniref:Sodium/hydrogen exchanger family protein n=1 Tax=Edaphobacter modestus TaxID=388466 RepID=A0A4Q7YMK1_9BACT|nr:hypothetical protein BDD14_0304 [Edaphobacter modestus]